MTRRVWTAFQRSSLERDNTAKESTNNDESLDLSSGIALVSVDSAGLLSLIGNDEGLLIMDESDPKNPIPLSILHLKRDK
ncbi:hypothetical protein [Candidatus Albibeggiatoa sp. nov. BB20]|uniref:hypothetical protein n=1 Tax=Candidatus Albibeggiatoa sp. nov. BB20 TaxID=3162723 RepID=UPI003365419E